jgi:hypothetical protein
LKFIRRNNRLTTFYERVINVKSDRQKRIDIIGKVKVKQSRYTPWRRLGGEEVYLLLVLDLGTR